MNEEKIQKVTWGYGTFHYPHGWLGFNYDFSGICPTIDSGIWEHHTLLIEVKKSNNEKYKNLIKLCDSKEIINYGYIGVGGQKGYVYSVNGICNTLPATQYKDPTKIMIEVKNEADSTRIYGQRNRKTPE